MNILKKGLFYLFFHLNFVFNTITEKSKLVLSKKYIIPIGFSILNFSLLAWAWWRKENKNLFHGLALSSSGIAAASYLSFMQKLKIKEKKKLLAPHLLLSLFAIDGLIMAGGYHHNNDNNYNLIIYAGLMNIFRFISIFYDVNKEYASIKEEKIKQQEKEKIKENKEKVEKPMNEVVKFQKVETTLQAVNQRKITEIDEKRLYDFILYEVVPKQKQYFDDWQLMHSLSGAMKIRKKFSINDSQIVIKSSFYLYTWYILKMTLEYFIQNSDKKQFLGYKIWIKQQTLEGLKQKIIEDNDDNWRNESDQFKKFLEEQTLENIEKIIEEDSGEIL